VEVVDTTRYLVNTYPSLALVNTKTNEVWYAKNPSVSYLKVFGCDAFVHVLKEKRRNLDKKEFKCIFIGHEECSVVLG
jgi:hypothetical protein